MHDIVQQEVDVNIVVETFSKFVTDRANVFFKKTHTVKHETMFTNSISAEMKKWYYEIFMQKKQTVQEAVRDFNLFKSEDNRKKVYEAKKDYKYYCRKCKQDFNRERCKQMNDMRKKKLKEFWKIFKNKKSGKIRIYRKMIFIIILRISRPKLLIISLMKSKIFWKLMLQLKIVLHSQKWIYKYHMMKLKKLSRDLRVIKVVVAMIF